MKTGVRTIIATGVLGCAALGFVPLGCTSRLGPVRATQNGGIDHPNLADITVEHAKDCVAEYGPQLEPGYHVLNSSVLVDEDGDKVDVTINDIPNTAPDFGACMRNALRDMPISEDRVREAAKYLKVQRKQASAAQRSLVSSPVVVVVGVTIVVSELFLEAGAITILFAVTVKVVEKAKDDVLDVAKRWRPKPNKNRCLDAAAGGEYMWEEFCRSMTVPGNCWAKTLESEQNKRGWCNEKFGS